MEKSPTYIGLGQYVKLWSGKKNDLKKKLKKTDELVAQVSAINKEIENLKFEIVTKDQLLSIPASCHQWSFIGNICWCVCQELQEM